jgi:hypothetical protein
MADNFTILDSVSGTQTVRTTDLGSNVHIPLAVSDALPLADVTLTRPADVTAYAAGDAVTNSTSAPTALTFTNIGNKNGGSFTITSAMLISSNQAGNALFTLELFNGSAAPTATNDNAAYNPSDSNRNNVCGAIIFPTANVIAGSSNKIYIGSLPPLPASRCNSGTSSIFGLLRVGAAYTPISAETFVIRLFGFRDN